MVGLGCDCGTTRRAIDVRVGYIRPPVVASGYYFPRTSRRGGVRSRRSPVALSPNYRFLGQPDTGPDIGPVPSAQNILSAGSRLIYKVTFLAPDYRVFTGESAAQLAAQISAALQRKLGIRLVSQNFGDPSASSQSRRATFQVVTTVDYGQADDVRSIIDGELYASGRRVVNSTINVMSPGAGDVAITPPGPPQPFDLGQFFSDNWPWMLAIGGGLYAAKELL